MLLDRRVTSADATFRSVSLACWDRAQGALSVQSPTRDSRSDPRPRVCGVRSRSPDRAPSKTLFFNICLLYPTSPRITHHLPHTAEWRVGAVRGGFLVKLKGRGRWCAAARSAGRLRCGHLFLLRFFRAAGMACGTAGAAGMADPPSATWSFGAAAAACSGVIPRAAGILPGSGGMPAAARMSGCRSVTVCEARGTHGAVSEGAQGGWLEVRARHRAWL